MRRKKEILNTLIGESRKSKGMLERIETGCGKIIGFQITVLNEVYTTNLIHVKTYILRLVYGSQIGGL